MSSFVISKLKMKVLFEILNIPNVVIGISGFPEVDKKHFNQLKDIMINEEIIVEHNGICVPDKGLENFLVPLIESKTVFIYNQGVENICVFNATMYFSKKGVVAVYDNYDETVTFIRIESFNDLKLFIPDIIVLKNSVKEKYVSYIIIEKDFSIVHCTKISSKNRDANIIEGMRKKEMRAYETKLIVSVEEYQEMIYTKLEEVYCAASC